MNITTKGMPSCKQWLIPLQDRVIHLCNVERTIQVHHQNVATLDVMKYLMTNVGILTKHATTLAEFLDKKNRPLWQELCLQTKKGVPIHHRNTSRYC